DRLLRREDLCRLGHEMDAAEDDRVRVGRGGLPREPERVTDVVRDVLHLGHLVVVREDDRVARARELAHLLVQRQRRNREGTHSTSSETCSERAECVSAPTETKSTPVSAYAQTVASEMPPDASSCARPPTNSTARRTSSGVMLSSRIRSAPAA